MFYHWIRGLLFRLDAERVHDISLLFLRLFHRSGAFRLMPAGKSLPRKCMGLHFPNPVGLAAGFDKNGDCIEGLAALGFGFIEVGTITPLAQPGNARPRLFRIPEKQAIINRMGFNNKGVDHLVNNLKKCRFQGIIGVNIGKNKNTPLKNAVDDYLFCLKKVYPHADYVAVNISSPNTADLRKLQMADHLNRLLSCLMDERVALERRHGKRVPLAVKLSPDMTDTQIDTTTDILMAHQIDAIIATNTTVARPRVAHLGIAAETGGLSGNPLRNKARHVLERISGRVGKKTALIATGAIMDPGEARQRMVSGADLVQLYSGLVYEGPFLVKNTVDSIDTG